MKTMMLSKLILGCLFILPLYNVGAQEAEFIDESCKSESCCVDNDRGKFSRFEVQPRYICVADDSGDDIGGPGGTGDCQPRSQADCNDYSTYQNGQCICNNGDPNCTATAHPYQNNCTPRTMNFDAREHFMKANDFIHYMKVQSQVNPKTAQLGRIQDCEYNPEQSRENGCAGPGGTGNEPPNSPPTGNGPTCDDGTTCQNGEICEEDTTNASNVIGICYRIPWENVCREEGKDVNEAGDGCSCSQEQELINGECIDKCPNNQVRGEQNPNKCLCPGELTLNAQGQCVCPQGQTIVGDQCMQTACTEPKINSNNECVCPSGMQPSGESCTCTGANEQYSYATKRCECTGSLVRVNGTCQQQRPPGSNPNCYKLFSGSDRWKHISPNGRFKSKNMDSINCRNAF